MKRKSTKEIIKYFKEENTIAHMNNSGLLSEDEFDANCDDILTNDKQQRAEIKRLKELNEYLQKQLDSPIIYQTENNVTKDEIEKAIVDGVTRTL